MIESRWKVKISSFETHQLKDGTAVSTIEGMVVNRPDTGQFDFTSAPIELVSSDKVLMRLSLSEAFDSFGLGPNEFLAGSDKEIPVSFQQLIEEPGLFLRAPGIPF